ncbi:CCDC90 family protein [Erwiniaceae bacterium BAC15a-03b]|uniref:CCDC90 family protein n=1 Tax=Winslowiella arboricola TaxID=2978220 RepID=A0A9J6PTP9_9GAMM|nr:coiled-coil domain-containing protein [Winslowiella arboricola]MCU5774786.1 CCDC90 family protein [Winslowiella arboricola]MCU5780062.1 CCDC90 family protein [Winslowiella arboricola]
MRGEFADYLRYAYIKGVIPMVAIPLDTHRAIKELQDAGINEKQAEAMVKLVGGVYNSEIATKSDLNLLHENIKSDLKCMRTDMNGMRTELESELKSIRTDLQSELKSIHTDLDWIKKFMLAIGLAALIAAVKYIFIV